MSVIRTCTHCQQKNRVSAKHLSASGRCGACKPSFLHSPSRWQSTPRCLTILSRMQLCPSWWTSGPAGAVPVEPPLPRFPAPPPIWLERPSCLRSTRKLIPNLPPVFRFAVFPTSLCSRVAALSFSSLGWWTMNRWRSGSIQPPCENASSRCTGLSCRVLCRGIFW